MKTATTTELRKNIRRVEALLDDHEPILITRYGRTFALLTKNQEAKGMSCKKNRQK